MKAHPRKQLAPIAIAALLSLGFGAPLSAAAAPIVVNSTADNTTAADAQCTLREAITNANSDTDGTSGDCTAGSGADTITFAPTLAGQTINLSSVLPNLFTEMTIVGPGAEQLTVKRDTGGKYRVFTIFTATVGISGLTISNGDLGTNGSFPSNAGGGIFNDGTLRLGDCIISGNAANFGAGLFNHNNRALYVTNCRLEGNSAVQLGGGLYNNSGSGTIYLTNSSVRGNSADEGGGVYVLTDSALIATNSTLSGNTATTEGGGLYNDAGVARFTGVTVTNNRATENGGGTCANGGNLLLRDTIIAGNFEGAGSTANDIGNGGLDSGSSHNVIGTGAGALAGSNGNQTGIDDPGLGPLAYNGGATPTHALLPGSPAIDAGIAFTTLNTIDASQTSCKVQDANAFPEGVGFTIQIDDEQMSVVSKSGDILTVERGANGTTAVAHGSGSAVNPAFDQRGPGFRRVTGDAIDIGAFEANGLVVNNTGDDLDLNPGDGICDSGQEQCSLRAAIQEANALENSDSGVKTIAFDIPGAGPHTIQLTGVLPDLSQSVNILNESGKSITIRRDTGGDYRIFFVGADAMVRMVGLELTNGQTRTTDPHGNFGGAIRNDGALILRKMWIHGNSVGLVEADGNAGGIYNKGTLTVIASTCSENAGRYGGGLANVGTAAVTNCTFSNNTAEQYGAGIFNENPGLLTVTSSTVANNTATLGSNGGILGQISENTVLRNTIAANNSAPNFPNDPADVENVTSGGYNLIKDPNGFTPKATDITGFDPHLGPRQDNGGPTPTHALLGCSPAIDTGKNLATDENGDPIVTDQRGFQRRVDQDGYPNTAGSSDRGAFEVQAAADVSQPTVAIAQAPNQSDPTSVSTIRFSAEFSEQVTGFDNSDVVLSSTAGPATANAVPVSATAYRIDVSGMTKNGKVTVKIPQDVAFDAHGDGNAPSTGDSTVTYSVTDEQTEFVVNSLADTDDGSCDPLSSNQDCTLREAIDAANADLGAETITFAPALTDGAPAAVTLKRALPDIVTPMTIRGPRADRLDIRRSAAGDTPRFRIFLIKAGVTAAIERLTVSNGNLPELENGAGILNRGTLRVLACKLRGNRADRSESGGGGGGIASSGRLEVRESTFTANQASFGGGIAVLKGSLYVASTTFDGNIIATSGGGIHSSGVAKVVNSTFSANGGTFAGGIMSDTGSSLSVANCTFSRNRASTNGSAILVKASHARVGNSIFRTPGDGNRDSIAIMNNGSITSAGYNLSSDAVGGNNSPGPGGLLNSPGDQRNTDPKLRPLANHGGPTLTHAPAAESPAIDMGKNLARNPSKQLIEKDQRGEPRPVRFDKSIAKPEGGDGSDIGAVERAAPAP